MAILVVGSQAQRYTLDVDTTAYNPSLTVSILVGNTSSPDTPIPPQGAFILTGGQQYWFQTSDGSVQEVLFLTGLTGLIPSPAQIAAQLTQSGLASAIATDIAGSPLAGNTATSISGMGVPLLTASTALVDQAGQTIAASGTKSLGPFAVTQPSFELIISAAYNTVNGNNPFLFVTINWTDTASGLLVDNETFVTAYGGIANPLRTRIKGPTRGNQVTVEIYNLDPAQVALLSYSLLTNSRTVLTEQIDWVSDFFENPGIAVPNHTLPNILLPDSRTLGIVSDSALGAGVSEGFLFPPHSGPATINVWENGVAGGNIQLSIQPVPSTIYNSVQTPWMINDVLVAGNPNKYFNTFYVPNGPFQVNVKNAGSVNAAYTVIVIGG